MKKIILLVIIILLNGNTFASENLEQIKPNWKIHDKWIVRTWYGIANCTITGVVKVGEAPCDVTFEVKNDTNYINETACYELFVTYPTSEVGTKQQYKLYYSKNNYKLLQVINCYKRRNGTARNDKVFDYFKSSDTSHISSGIPFEFPDFTQSTNFVKKIKNIVHVQNVEKDSDDNTITVTLQCKYKGRDTDQKVIQKWQPGLPWPKETKKVESHGKIIKSNFLKRIK